MNRNTQWWVLSIRVLKSKMSCELSGGGEGDKSCRLSHFSSSSAPCPACYSDFDPELCLLSQLGLQGQTGRLLHRLNNPY